MCNRTIVLEEAVQSRLSVSGLFKKVGVIRRDGKHILFEASVFLNCINTRLYKLFQRIETIIDHRIGEAIWYGVKLADFDMCVAQPRFIVSDELGNA
jgi:hypothetical protein